ncbi:MAG: single-stranded DNA-binding protein [bacterium]|nr:single-stranded DNA-binding protein [bacterium]
MANRSINKVTILGNLTRDPELKFTPSGTAVCTFSVATNRTWTTKEGQTREDVQYHRFVAWQKLAELCGKLLTKGKRVYCEGRITYREYKDKNDQQRFITEIVLDDFIVFYDNETQAGSNSEGNSTDMSADKTSKEHPKKESANEPDTQGNDEDVNPEDIPF